jgi:hypothetical protein
MELSGPVKACNGIALTLSLVTTTRIGYNISTLPLLLSYVHITQTDP